MGSLAGRLFVCRILARQHLERSVQLRVPPGGVAEIERHLDVRRNAAALQALAIDPALGHRDYEKRAIAQTRRPSAEVRARGALADEPSHAVLLRAIGDGLLAAARTAVDEQHRRLSDLFIA